MRGRPIMIRRVGIAWLVSPWQDLQPHDAGEERCGQKTKCARSKIGQTRCLLLWISDSPFRIIDGGSCSISLVVNQSLGASFAHTPWPRTSLPSQWLSRRALHIVYTQPENMFCLGTRNMPPFKDWVIFFFIWCKAATVCTTWFNIQNKLLLSGKFFWLHWPLIPHPGGRRCLHMLTSKAYTHEVNILDRREDTWARLLIGLQWAFSRHIASSRIYEIRGCYV